MDAERATETIVAAAPPRLRLDELLGELGARDPSGPTPQAEAGVPRPDKLAIDDLVIKAAEGGFGFLVGILSLVAIPFVGLSTPFGLALALIGAQMMVGRREPWLPARVRRRALALTMLDRVLVLLRTRMRWLAKSTRRRAEWLIMPRLIGASVVFLALGLALPLPIPGSNMVFLIPLFIYGIALLERDGVWIAIAHGLAVVDAVLLVVFGKTVELVLVRIWHWLT